MLHFYFLLGNTSLLHALGKSTLEEGAASLLGESWGHPPDVPWDCWFPLLGPHTLTLSNLPAHFSCALLILHYLLICFICLLVYGPNHPGCKFLES